MLCVDLVSAEAARELAGFLFCQLLVSCCTQIVHKNKLKEQPFPTMKFFWNVNMGEEVRCKWRHLCSNTIALAPIGLLQLHCNFIATPALHIAQCVAHLQHKQRQQHELSLFIFSAYEAYESKKRATDSKTVVEIEAAHFFQQIEWLAKGRECSSTTGNNFLGFLLFSYQTLPYVTIHPRLKLA